MKQYYRLFDLQIQDYLFTCYNTTSLHELAGDYAEYVSIDIDEETDSLFFKKITLSTLLWLIKSNEFKIEVSHNKFKELEY